MKSRIFTRLFASLCALFFIAACLLQLPIKAEALSVMINTWDTYEEYREGIRKARHSLGFVEYEDIKILGDFKAYHFIGYDGRSIFSKYPLSHFDWDLEAYLKQYFTRYEYAVFELTDANQFTIKIEIADNYSLLHSYGFPHYESDPLTRPKGMSDMRTLGTEGTGFLKQGSLLYLYYKGELSAIIFQLGQTCFHITGDLDQYPIYSQQTILSQLLSTDEAVTEQAYRRVIADIPAQGGYYTPLIVDGIVILCVTAGVCVAAVIITKRIRKRRMAQEQANDPDASASME